MKDFATELNESNWNPGATPQEPIETDQAEETSSDKNQEKK